MAESKLENSKKLGTDLEAADVEKFHKWTYANGHSRFAVATGAMMLLQIIPQSLLQLALQRDEDELRKWFDIAHEAIVLREAREILLREKREVPQARSDTKSTTAGKR